MEDYSLYALYIGVRMFVGKSAEEDGRRVLNDACEVRAVIMGPGNIQEQGLMLGKLFIPVDGGFILAKLSRESVYSKLYTQMTTGLKLV